MNRTKLKFFKETLNEKNAAKAKDAEIISVFVDSNINQRLIDKLPKLKFIATRSTGFDHIDIAYCKKKGIIVSNVPTYGENTVAEHAFALILTLSRKLYPSIERTHEQHSFETDHSLMGFDLKGKTLGVIGCGHIGKHVVRIGTGFEMNVLVFEPHPDKKLAKRFGFKYTNINNLLKKSDIITLHVPYNNKTHHLINEKAIKKMKHGVIIINTSRGSVVDTNSLVEGLKNKKIAGAGLDVIEEEDCIKEERELLKENLERACNLKTLLENHILMEMDNVIITPHNAFNSKEALQRILNITLENIIAFAKKKPLNKV